MLVSVIESIGLVASNSLAVFCFCNVIIAILVVASSNTSARFNVEVTTEPNRYYRLSKSVVMEANDLISISEEEKESSVSIDMVESQEEDREEDEEEEDVADEDDELRKRVEEFIEKINRGWEKEKMNRLCQ